MSYRELFQIRKGLALYKQQRSPYWYVRYYRPAGEKRYQFKSTKTQSRSAALRFAEDFVRQWEETGLVTKPAQRSAPTSITAKTTAFETLMLALDMAVKRHDFEQAFDLIEANGGWRLVMQGGGPALSTVVNHIKSSDRAKYPNCVLTRAFDLAKRGQVSAARKIIGEIKRTEGEFPSSEIVPGELQREIELVDTHVGIYEDRVMGEAEGLRLQSVLSALPTGDSLGRALAMNHLCLINLHLGKFSLSYRYGTNAIKYYEASSAIFGAVHLHAHLGQICYARGDLDGAQREYATMAGRAEALPEQNTELVAISKALMSEVAYEMNDIAAAERLVTEAMRSVEGSDSWFDVLAATYRVSARLAYLKSSLPSALSALANAEKTATERQMPRLHRLVQIERIRVLTLSNELGEAEKEIRRADLDRFLDPAMGNMETDWSMRLGVTAGTLARFLIQSRRADKAIKILDRSERIILRGDQLLAVAKLRVMRAAAYWQLRNEKVAVDALCSALQLLGNQQFSRFVLDERLQIPDLLKAAVRRISRVDGVSRNVRRKLVELNHQLNIDGTNLKSPFEVSVGVRSKNSASDTYARQYLQLLAIGQSNKEIARTLGVSSNTVKYHLKNMFRDLDVANRTQAVFRGRELGLIHGR